jgi:hypothetical protein
MHVPLEHPVGTCKAAQKIHLDKHNKVIEENVILK